VLSNLTTLRRTLMFCAPFYQPALVSASFKLALPSVSGSPASVFTAIPVNSGFSDYYGGSVALGNIQVHLFPLASIAVLLRLFPLGNPHLAIIK
jgi:hypothetical protein